MPSARPPDEPWFVGAFDRTWLQIYPHREDEEARRAAPALQDLLRVRPGQRLLDVACGAGRYARALTARGLRVTGVDLSPDLIAVARSRGPHDPGKPDYLRWDVRRLPFARQFAGAVSMFTSFGYFDTPEDDVAIFRGVARALVPGARFVLDFLNEAQVRATLVPREETRQGTLLVHAERRIEDASHGPCVFKVVEARESRSGRLLTAFEERVRLYTRSEVDALLVRGGLEPVGEPLGSVHGDPFGPEASRLVRVAVAS